VTKARLGKVITAVVCMMLSTAATSQTAEYMVDKSDFSIQKPLTAKAGDVANGRKAAISRKKGNCLACHAMPIPEQPFHGRIAPALMGVGARYSAAQLRLRVVNPKVVNPHTIMPAFYKTDGYNRPLEKFAGKPILSAQEIEDVVAYLATLK
jgi:sulfur-oxidizing protein SoxX